MTTVKPVQIGLIGCGARLRVVIDHLLEATDQVRISAIQDPHEASVKAAREKFNPDMKVYPDVDSLLADPEIDWVMIGSWNCCHAEQILAAFAAGKHVFCEKPLALSVDDCIRVRDAAKTSGLQFTLGFTLRYSPHYVKIREIIESGQLGELISFEFNETLDFDHGGYIHADWRRKTEWAGTHLLEKCCHDIDLANWMTGSVAVQAASFGDCNFFTPANAHHKERLGEHASGRSPFCTWNHDGIVGNIIDPFNDDKDIVDNQVAILQYASGVRATFHTNCATAIPERRMYICGSEGTLRADVLSGSIELKRMGYNTEIETLDSGAKGGHGDGDHVLGRSLADSMLNGAPSRSSIDSALQAAVTVFGMDEALRQNTVFDLRPWWEQAGISIL